MARKKEHKEIRTKVAGVTFKNDDGSSRQKLIKKHARRNVSLQLDHQENNLVDPNAVAVCIVEKRLLRSDRLHQIGFLNKSVASQVLNHHRSGGKLGAVITEVTGGTKAKPTLGVNILIVLA